MKTKVWIALLAVYIVWGSTYLAIRFGVMTIPPFILAGTRFLIAGTILLIWRRAAGDRFPTPRQWLSTAVAGTLLLLGGNGLVSFSEQRVPSGIAALMVGSVPLWMVLIEAIRPGGVKPGWRAIIGLLIGFGGIFLLVGPAEFTQGGGGFDPLGMGALMVASFLWALGSIYSKSADMPKSSLVSTGAEMLCGSAALYVFAGIAGEWSKLNISAVSTPSWLGLGYLIAFGSLIGFVAYGWLLQNAPVSLVATYAYVNPVVAVFLGNLIAQETLTSRTILAAVIIIGSVIFINSAHPPKVRPPEAVKGSEKEAEAVSAKIGD